MELFTDADVDMASDSLKIRDLARVLRKRRSESMLLITAIDPCLDNNGGCQHHCTNNHGRAQCQCYPGFHLSYDRLSCVGKFPRKLCSSKLWL